MEPLHHVAGADPDAQAWARWLYAFVRFMTRQRSGDGDESRERGAALDDFIEHEGGSA